ncbi:MAG: hypothetical protein AAFU85_09605 [Planctomycetota bacterium]
MQSFFRSIAEKWNNWVGDKDMEVAIRRHLTQKGYFGGSVKLRNVRLVAVQRPGWLQVYRFEATARVSSGQTQDSSDDAQAPNDQAQYQDLYGLVRDDARKSMTKVEVFQNPAERRALFRRWSEDLIQLRGAQGLG